MLWLPDPTGRFVKRPFYEVDELEATCEAAIHQFYRDRLKRAFTPPVTDNELQTFVEAHVGDLDLYADLSEEGQEVEALTEFRPGLLPVVRVEQTLSGDPRRRNRLRTSLSHELGHILLHRFLFEEQWKQGNLFASLGKQSDQHKAVCMRQTMLRASCSDWAEWQAGYACGALLMPKSSVVHFIRDFAGTNRNGPIFGSPLDSVTTMMTVLAVAERFDVSEEAARVRLEVLKLLN